MTQFLQIWLSHLASLGGWTYLIVFILTYFETVILVGHFLPGSLMLAFVGFLCYLQVFDFSEMFLLVFAAHLLGECTNYLLGRQKGRELFTEDARILRKSFLEVAERQFAAHGGLFFLPCQFSGVFRPIVSFLAGASNYPFLRFLAWMVLACASWTIVHLGAGFILGASWQETTKYLGGFSLVVLVALASTLFTGWLIQTLWRYRGALGAWLVDRGILILASPYYRNLADRHPRVFRFIERRLSLSQPWGLQATVAWCAVAAVAMATLILAHAIDHSASLHHFDHASVALMAQLRRAGPLELNFYFSTLGQGRWMMLAAIVAAVAAAMRRQQVSALMLLLSVSLSLCTSEAIKIVVARTRPDMPVAAAMATGFSFPSSHVAAASAFFCATTAWAWRHHGNTKLKVSLAFLGLSIIPLIAFSRVYLGVHYPSDLLGGAYVGLGAFLTAFILAQNLPRLEEQLGRVDLILASLYAALFAGALLYHGRTVRLGEQGPALRESMQYASLEDVIARLPREARRLTGEPSIPINVVLLGNPQEMLERLQKRGWREVSPNAFFTSDATRPIFPGFVDMQPAEYTLALETTGTREVLRLWRSAYRVHDCDVWVGSAIWEVLRRRVLLLEIYKVDPDIDLATEQWCREVRTPPCETISQFRPRGLYSRRHPYFTHGSAALIREFGCSP